MWVRNDDIGFVHPGQQVTLKFAAFQFQKYGMVDGRVSQVSADASDGTAGNADNADQGTGQLYYRALVDLGQPYLLSEGQRLALAAGMQVTAEIMLGDRTVLEYLFSPLGKAFHEAGRER